GERRTVLRWQEQRSECDALDPDQREAAVRAGVYDALQRIPVRTDQRRRGAGLWRRPGHGGARRSFQTDDAARNGFRLLGHVLSGAKSAGGSTRFGDLRTFAAVRLPDLGGVV